MDIAGYTAKSPASRALLQKLPPKLLESARLVRLPAGRIVVLRGEVVEWAYFILEGELIVFHETLEGKFSTWLTMQAPTVISDLEVLSEIEHYAANVSAATDCVALRCPITTFTAALRQDVDFLWTIATTVSKKNYTLVSNRGYSAFRSSLEKTALFLLYYGSLHPAKPGKELVVQRTRAQMSSEVVVSQKTLDRCLLRLRDEGYISIERGKVHISPAQLEKLLATWGHTQ